MRRVHAFEFHERPECPRVIRDAVVETLGIASRWGRFYDRVGPVFANFCRLSRTQTILDLCSGSGEPASSLIAALSKCEIRFPRFLLSDLFPNLPAMRVVAQRHATVVEVIETAVDATNVPEDIAYDACSIIGAFHHFSPVMAEKILADCVRKQRAVFILEPFDGKFLSYLATAPALLAAGLANPFMTQNRRWLKALCSYVFPVLGLVGFWDGLINSLRIYSPKELLSMAQKLGGNNYEWHFEKAPFPPGGAAQVFWGIPKARFFGPQTLTTESSSGGFAQ